MVSHKAVPTSRQRLLKCPSRPNTVREETSAPILYVLGYDELKDAIKIQNDVSHGLSSCIFTLNMREAEPATGNWDQPTRPNWDTVLFV
jgi:hypothetical protein